MAILKAFAQMGVVCLIILSCILALSPLLASNENQMRVFLLIGLSLFVGIRAIYWTTVARCITACCVFTVLTPMIDNGLSKFGLFVLVFIFWFIAYQTVVKREKEEERWQEACRASRKSPVPVEYPYENVDLQ